MSHKTIDSHCQTCILCVVKVNKNQQRQGEYMTSWNDIKIQSDKSLLILKYHHGRCYAVRLAPGTSIEGTISVAHKFGFDYEPYNEATGEFMPGKPVHIKG